MHFGAFRTSLRTAKQVEQTLVDAGLLDADTSQKTDTPEIGGKALNRNSGNWNLIKCLLLAGVYPNIGFNTKGKGKTHRTASEENVVMHPGSVNIDRTNPKHKPPKHNQLYAFTNLVRSIDGDALFMRDSSLITPLAVLLFGGRLEALEADKELIMDEWLPFKFDVVDARQSMSLVMEFRKAKDRMLNGVFRLLSNPNETAKAVDVMEVFADGLVRLLDAYGDQDLNEGTSSVDPNASQEDAWADMSQLYSSNAVARMEIV